MTVNPEGQSGGSPLIDLRDTDIGLSVVSRALRNPADERIRCDPPGALHDRVGLVTSETSVAIRPALALTMRSRGIATPIDRRLATAERERAAVEIPETDLGAARVSVAKAEGGVRALRERVARLGGRVNALRELDGGDPTDAEADLAGVTTDLAETETALIAAEQRLDAARSRARRVRDARERRLRLTDRVANRRQEARDHLVANGWDPFTRAVAALPMDARAGEEPATFHGPNWAAALALISLARLTTPIVVTATDPADVVSSSALGVPAILM